MATSLPIPDKVRHAVCAYHEYFAPRRLDKIVRNWPEKESGKMMSELHLYCHVCKNKRILIEEKIPKFSGFLRILGMVIATVSLLCFLFALAFAVVVIGKEFGLIEPATYQSGTGGAIFIDEMQLSFSLFFGALSASGGLASFILLRKKKVYRCSTCGSVIEKIDDGPKKGG